MNLLLASTTSVGTELSKNFLKYDLLISNLLVFLCNSVTSSPTTGIFMCFPANDNA